MDFMCGPCVDDVWTMCGRYVDKTVIYGFYQKGHLEVKNKIPSQAARINLVKTNWRDLCLLKAAQTLLCDYLVENRKKSILHVGPQSKIGQKMHFFRFFQKCTRSPLYIKKARRMCLGHPKCIFPAIYRPYEHL